ncbi:hypothetical protein ACM41_20575 [Bradyrhizobium sp. CCBAU 21362]|uniref:hypothetical protein n=1 Tax=Bradyrhizobium sp. CCBAU 21362 TaxID=1325082 RepID=UPI0023053209|nr:hypothetical protein [Bradyrhizobium sp. CCBAU 21362]MDA9538516.1 hypothetical protein [Bradyrhizobium sp. CCBAU 21362]
MSAIVLQFPLAHAEESNILDGCVDVSPVDRRGFVILDACVSPVLGIQLLTLLGNHERKSTLPCPNASIVLHDRNAFAFECTQVEPNGNYLIEACIPLAVAIDFERMRAATRGAPSQPE